MDQANPMDPRIEEVSRVRGYLAGVERDKTL